MITNNCLLPFYLKILQVGRLHFIQNIGWDSRQSKFRLGGNTSGYKTAVLFQAVICIFLIIQSWHIRHQINSIQNMVNIFLVYTTCQGLCLALAYREQNENTVTFLNCVVEVAEKNSGKVHNFICHVKNK